MRGVALAFAMVCLVPAVALAQPGEPVATAEPVAAEAGYPVSLAARPLVLPQGVFEVSAQLRTNSMGQIEIEFLDFLYTDLRARAGAGPVEVFAETDLLLESPDTYGDRSSLDRVAGGVLVPVGRGMAGRLRASLWYPTEDYKSLEVQGVFLVRRQTAANVAIQGGGGLGLIRILPPEGGEGDHVVNAEGELGAQVQLKPRLGVDFSFRVTVPVADSYPEEYDYPRIFYTRAGGSLVYTSRHLDAYAGLGIAAGYVGERVFVVGLVGRVP
jgi:hypothetical protein